MFPPGATQEDEMCQVPRESPESPLEARCPSEHIRPLRSMGRSGGWQGGLWSSSKPPPSTDWATSLTSLPLTVGSGARSNL